MTKYWSLESSSSALRHSKDRSRYHNESNDKYLIMSDVLVALHMPLRVMAWTLHN